MMIMINIDDSGICFSFLSNDLIHFRSRIRSKESKKFQLFCQIYKTSNRCFIEGTIEFKRKHEMIINL